MENILTGWMVGKMLCLGLAPFPVTPSLQGVGGLREPLLLLCLATRSFTMTPKWGLLLVRGMVTTYMRAHGDDPSLKLSVGQMINEIYVIFNHNWKTVLRR